MKRKWRQFRHWLKKRWEPIAWLFHDVREAVTKPVVKLARRVSTWWENRRGRYLLQGLPALLLALGVIFLAAVVIAGKVGSDRQQLASHYQMQAAQSMVARNWDAARVAYERLAVLDDDKPDHRYALALALQGLGQKERAVGLMGALAPLDGPQGFAPAHLWLGLIYYSQSGSNPRAQQLAEQHLTRVVKLQPEAVEAHIMLAQIYMRNSQFDKAEKHFLAGARVRPEIGLMLAGLYKERGQKENQLFWCQRSAKYFQGQLEADSGNHPARLNLAEAKLLGGQFAEARTLLQQGLALSNADVYKTRLAKNSIVWFDSLPNETDADRGQRLALIEEGLKYDPKNTELLSRLIDATSLEGDEADKARTVLQGILAQGKATGPLHFMLGVDALKQEKNELALHHFDQAFKLTPQMPDVANNLAWMLAHKEKPDLPRALDMIDSVLKRQPKDARYRETRGQILAKMARWKEALDDLSAALPELPDEKGLHATMAEAYRQLGFKDLAEQHQKLAGDKKQ
jgi:Tfp pilus assembly protein PilF